MGNKLAVKVAVIESESGWGSRVDDYMVCLSNDDAIKSIELLVKTLGEAIKSGYKDYDPAYF